MSQQRRPRGAHADPARGKALKIEARVVRAVRTRAAGIGSCRTLEQKLRRWAESASVAAEPLLERLRTPAPEASAAAVLGEDKDAQQADIGVEQKLDQAADDASICTVFARD